MTGSTGIKVSLIPAIVHPELGVPRNNPPLGNSSVTTVGFLGVPGTLKRFNFVVSYASPVKSDEGASLQSPTRRFPMKGYPLILASTAPETLCQSCAAAAPASSAPLKRLTELPTRR